MAAKERGQTGASSLPFSPPLLLYRIIDGAVRSREDRLKSLIDISKLDVDLLYQLVYSKREIPGIGVLATPAAETGGLGPTRIVDIAVVHQTDQTDQAKAVFEGELQASENRKRQRMQIFRKSILPHIKKMHRDALIEAAALRGSSFEDHRYATPFDDLDMLLFIERPEREAEIVKRLGEIEDCRSISYLQPQKFEYGEHSASHSGQTRQLRMGGVGRHDVEFDLIAMKDWIEFVERTGSKDYSVETILTSKTVLGRSYLEENRKAIIEALANRGR